EGRGGARTARADDHRVVTWLEAVGCIHCDDFQAAVRMRQRLKWAARSAASSPAPSMNDDLRRRMNGSPRTYIPGAATTPPSCLMRPLRSSTGTSSQE